MLWGSHTEAVTVFDFGVVRDSGSKSSYMPHFRERFRIQFGEWTHF